MSQKRVKRIEFLFGRNDYFEEGTNHADFHGDTNYWFLVIDNHHSAVKYFLHYYHDLNKNNWTYFKTECSNYMKAF